MKNIYILLLLFTTCTTVKSQVVRETPHDGSQTYDIAAPEYVQLKRNFEYKPEGNNYFHAYIDHNAFIPNFYEPEVNLDDRVLDYNLPVGSINGIADVSLLGAASYTIPIFCPPGTAGMKPSISLVYSSQAGNGIAGFGWSIAGLSSISRVPQNKYFDELSKGISLNDDDRCAMDGQRLLIVNGAYWGSESEYLTEVFNGMKVKLKMENGNKWFEVETSDKHIMEFGRTDDSQNYTSVDGIKKVISWNINKIEDSQHNYITFRYIKETIPAGQTKIMNYRISEIEYTGNFENNLTPYNKIQFVYANERIDFTQSFLQGIELYSDVLLKQIKIISENETVRKYDLSYFLDKKSFLQKISETGSDGTSINFTGYNYGTSSESRINNDIVLTPGVIKYCNEETSYQYQYADYNADGYTDILRVGLNKCDENNTFVVNYSLSINDNSTNGSDYTDGPLFTTLFSSNFSSFVPGEVVKSVTFADINGDGRADILELHEIGPLSSAVYNLECIFSKPSINNNDRYEIFSGIGGCKIPSVTAIEINGDGLADLMLTKYSYNGSMWKWQTEVFISNQQANAANFYTSAYLQVINLDFLADSPPNMLRFGDFDGDGFTDILFISGREAFKFYRFNGTNFVPSFSNIYDLHCSAVYLGDYNGDRNTDIFYYNQEWDEYIQLFDPETGDPLIDPLTGDYLYEMITHPLEWHLKYSTGKSFVDAPCPIIVGDPSDFKFLSGDFNSDGITDIMQITNDNVSIRMNLYSKVGNIYMKEGLTPDIENDATGSNHWEFNLTDFNGDGQPEIASLYNMNISLGQSMYNLGGILFTSYFYPNDKKKLLHKISDGFNNKQDFQYLPLTNTTVSGKITNPEFYIASYMGDIVPITIPLKVVSKSFNSNGIGGLFEKDYFYEQFLMHRRGKGVLGPKSFTVTNVTTGMSTRSLYGITFEAGTDRFASYMLEENQLSYNASLRSRTINSNTFKLIAYGAQNTQKRIYLPYAYQSFSDDYVNNLHTKKLINTSDVDDFGNISKVTTHYLDDDNSYDANWDVTDISLVATNSWYICKPKNISKKMIRAGETKDYLTEQHFEYFPDCSEDCNNSGLVQSITNFYGTPKAVKEVYLYDEWGNIKHTTISSTDPTVEVVTKAVMYESKGRFQSSVSNALGHTQLITTNKLGLVVSTTDPNSLRITYLYDGFGNIIQTTFPDGRTSSVVRKFRESGDPALVVYKIENTATGTPSTTTYFDLLGRVYRKSVKSFDGRYTNMENRYNYKGELEKTSDSYFANDPIPSDDKWIFYSYYPDGRTNTNTYPEYLEKYTYNSSNRESKVERFDRTGNTANVFKKTQLNFLGQVKTSFDNMGEIKYTYYATGLSHTVEGVDHKITETTYDDYYRQDKLIDPNSGTIKYEYDAYGMLRSETDAKNVVVLSNYDKLGRILHTESSIGNTITYVYDESGKPLGSLSKQTHSNGTQYEYFYDGLSRLSSENETIDGVNYTTSYTYNANCGEVETVTYPFGFVVRNEYTTDGFLQKVYKNNDATPLLNLPVASSTYNHRGQLTNYSLGNGIQVDKYFDTYGKSTGVKYGNAMNLAWQIYPVLGNLQWRKDITNPAIPLIENFAYTDNSRTRLNDYQVTGKDLNSATYDYNGNMKTKTDAGTYNYDDPNHANAVSTITNATNIPVDKFQDITYTDFGYTEEIIHRNETNQTLDLKITYGPDYSRVKTIFSNSTGIQKTKYFVGGNFEIEVFPDNSWRRLYYIPGPDGLIGICETKSNSSVEKMYYIHTDHLGSWKCITNEQGVVVEKMDYDPWGRRRNAADWSYNNIPSTFLFDRGYTGHEMLDAFGLINMNGRVYDPIIGRFLSPDNYIQAPDNTQGLNRYSYCLNNPLIYSDPSGELFWVMPMVNYNRSGGLDISITAGIGVPGVESASITLGYNFGSDNAYATLCGSVGMVSAYVGYGTQSGFYAGVSVGVPFPIAGFSSNLTSVGFSYSERGGFSMNAMGYQIGTDGSYSFDPSIGYSKAYNIGNSATQNSGNGIEPFVFDEEFINALNGSGYGKSYGGDKPGKSSQDPKDVTMLHKVTITGTRSKKFAAAGMGLEINFLTLSLNIGRFNSGNSQAWVITGASGPSNSIGINFYIAEVRSYKKDFNLEMMSGDGMEGSMSWGNAGYSRASNNFEYSKQSYMVNQYSMGIGVFNKTLGLYPTKTLVIPTPRIMLFNPVGIKHF